MYRHYEVGVHYTDVHNSWKRFFPHECCITMLTSYVVMSGNYITVYGLMFLGHIGLLSIQETFINIRMIVACSTNNTNIFFCCFFLGMGQYLLATDLHRAQQYHIQLTFFKFILFSSSFNLRGILCSSRSQGSRIRKQKN